MTHPKTLIAAHLDLRGIMFRPSYIPQLLADLAGQGINAVVADYEDNFPYKGVGITFDSSTKWSEKNFQTFLAEARKNRIEVIPMRQCVANLEYVLRWEKYRGFAMNRNHPSTLDVNNPKAKALIFEMLRQVLVAHPDSRYIHIGMDEAWALVNYDLARGKDGIHLFLNYLSEVCDICEAHGKMPMMCSDMLEDYMTPSRLKLFLKFKNRVVLCPWDYDAEGDRSAIGRMGGYRVSRKWLEEPDHPAAPTIWTAHTFIEDMPAAIRRIVRPYLKGRFFTTLFQVDVWRRLGFQVMGTTSVRVDSDGGTYPFYNKRAANIRAWGRAAKRARAIGVIATSWARGTSWRPPICNIDLTWPLITEFARSLGARPKPFFAGIPQRTVEVIVKFLGRCRADWRLETQVADQMEALAPRIKSHRHEWQSMIIMARLLPLHRRVEAAVSDVDYFNANNRPVNAEWQRRLDDQAGILKELAAMRRKVYSHFSKRYHGNGFEEWIYDIFDRHTRKLKDCRRTSLQMSKKSRPT